MAIPPAVHFRPESDRRVKGKPRRPARSPPATLDPLSIVLKYHIFEIIVTKSSHIVTLYHVIVVAHSINHRCGNRLSLPRRQSPNHIPVIDRQPYANLC